MYDPVHQDRWVQVEIEGRLGILIYLWITSKWLHRVQLAMIPNLAYASFPTFVIPSSVTDVLALGLSRVLRFYQTQKPKKYSLRPTSKHLKHSDYFRLVSAADLPSLDRCSALILCCDFRILVST